MKKNYILFLFLFIIQLGFSTEKTTNPSIALKLNGDYSFGSYNNNIIYTFTIKNTGDEVLTNVTLSNTFNINYSTCYPFDYNTNQIVPCAFTPIAILNPGEEITVYGYENYYFNGVDCEVYRYATVSANTINSSIIYDLSGYNFFNDYPTLITIQFFITDFNFTSTYLDLNNNSIVDVGDAVSYFLDTYSNFSSNSFSILPYNIYNSEPVILSSSVGYTNGNPITITQYLNSADVTSGYAYYQPDIQYIPNNCEYIGYYQTNICNNCPTPSNCYNCITTRLTDLLPNKISGKIKFDIQNDNCVTGINYPNRRVNTESNNVMYSSFSDNNGNYKIYIPNTGTFETNALNNLNSNFTSNPLISTIVSAGSNNNYTNNFCISSATAYTDLKVIIIPETDAVPGFGTNYKIYAYNQGSTSLDGSITLSYDNTKLSLQTQNPISNTNTSTSLTWNFTNLLPFEKNSYIVRFNVLPPPTVQSGDVLSFNVTSTQNLTDNVPSDNQYSLNQIVVNSYDPNDKTILEGEFITPSQATGYLYFLTRFQNEGTAPATTVVIKETLNSFLDWDTFEPVESSHTTNVQLRYGNDLTYTFSNIYLPHAASNEPASHGWMLYKIKPKNNFAIGDIITSSSDIYFDYNPAIITNTATTQIQVLSTENATKDFFKLYPNPVKNELNINTITNENYTISIVDINRKLMYSTQFSGNKTIDVSSFKSGFYFVNIKNENANQNYKLIKN